MSKLLIQHGGQQQHGVFHSESSETKLALIQKIFLCVAIIEELIRKIQGYSCFLRSCASFMSLMPGRVFQIPLSGDGVQPANHLGLSFLADKSVF